MTVIGIKEPGGPEVLVPEQRDVPELAADEVLIKVAAAGVNRPDVMQRKGLYPPPPGASDIPGLEVAGTIAALGPGAHGWQLGDSVCALVSGGGYAVYSPGYDWWDDRTPRLYELMFASAPAYNWLPNGNVPIGDISGDDVHRQLVPHSGTLECLLSCHRHLRNGQAPIPFRRPQTPAD